MKPDWRRWLNWLITAREEFPQQTDDRAWSLVLFLCGAMFWLLRRVSLHEHLKHFLFATDRSTEFLLPSPTAFFNDAILLAAACVYLLLGLIESPMITAMAVIALPPNLQFGRWIIALFFAIQLVQATFFHTVWRTVLPKFTGENNPLIRGGIVEENLARTGEPTAAEPGAGIVNIYSGVRNLLLAFLSYLELTWLFAIIYFYRFQHDFNKPLQSIGDAFYFSAVTTTTVGYGDLYPKADSGFLRLLVVFHLACTVVMVSVVVVRALGSVVGFRHWRG